MRITALPLLIPAFVLLGCSPLTAQTLADRVLDAGSGDAVRGTGVVLVTSQGFDHARTVTGDDGRFTLVAEVTGS